MGVNANYLLKVLQIANFSQITHSPTFGRAFAHENEKLWISRKSYFFSFNARREIHTAAVVLFSKIFVSPKMVAILNFRSFCKTQKCLYLENCARWSEFNKSFDLLDISAEYPCQFSKYFCLAKYSGHFEFFAKFAKHKNAYILKTVLDRVDCADFGCHNSIRLETEHFLNTLALTFISFSGRFVFAMQKHYLFFCERSSSFCLLSMSPKSFRSVV